MSKYMLLPLRTTVVFPGLPASVSVDEPVWATALERALTAGARVVALALRESDSDRLDPNNFFGIGTLADLKGVARRADGGADVVIEGIARVGIEAILTVRKPFHVRAVELEDEEQQAGSTLGQTRHAMALAERYSRLSHTLTPEVLETASAMRRPGPLADYLATHLPLDLTTKQDILEQPEPRQRLDRIIDALSAEIEILELDQKIRSRVRRQMEKNQREYYLKEQLKAITAELGQDATSEAETLRSRAREKRLPEAVETRVMQDIARLERTPPTSPETSVLRTYLDLVLALPWNDRTPDVLDVDLAQQVLDEDHYGLEQVKDRMLEFLAVKQLLLQGEGGEGAMARGPILCLVGPPGVGKTSLGRSVARALGRKFQRVSLGGVRDEAEIRGHRRTYVAAMAGRIISALKQPGSRNPVILLDEIDKFGADVRGDPAAALLEVLDPEQNHAFVDHYLDLPFDLSEVLFIATANVQVNIPRTLLDRMELVEISGYTEEEKCEIARRYLLPRQLKAHGLAAGQIEASARTFEEIIRGHTREAGVRGLERALATICRRAARQIVRQPGRRLRIDSRNLESFLGRPKFYESGVLDRAQIGVAVGLAWTDHGGEVLPVEAVSMPGKGNLLITGLLGNVMQESARAALSYARARALDLGIEPGRIETLDFHIHIPEGAIPKDGPSAGVTMATALISVLTGHAVPHDLAMTGEITLRGKVLPIGGLKDKVLAARRAGIRRVVAPAENRRDLPDIPRAARTGLEFIWVDTMDEVLQAVFGELWLGGAPDTAGMTAELAALPLGEAEPPFTGMQLREGA
jgi:ATP-dependent Lon protease